MISDRGAKVMRESKIFFRFPRRLVVEFRDLFSRSIVGAQPAAEEKIATEYTKNGATSLERGRR